MSLLVLVGILVPTVAVTVILMLTVRRMARTDTFLIDSTLGAGIFGVVGTAFAVVLAFVVLVAFESYNRAKNAAEAEAVAVVELFRTSDFFRDAERERFQAEAICYARAVVAEWQTMADGERSPLVDVWVSRLKETSKRFDLRSETEQAAFRHLLEQRDKRVEGRRERLSEADPVVTTPVWFILVLGALVTVLLVLLFADRRERAFVQGGMMAAVTTMVVAGLMLVWFLDHPYENKSGSIKPVEMERSLEIMKAERPGLPELCSPDARPRTRARLGNVG
jgi:Protein of unknown function (DUF4239)